MDQKEQILINSVGMAPTILSSHRDGVGINLVQGRNRMMLSGDELHPLLQAIDRPPTTTSPSKARLLSYPIMRNHPSSD
jgi:hypothetical protein